MKKEKRLEKILGVVVLSITAFTLLLLIYAAYKNISIGAFSLESALGKSVKQGEQYCSSQVIEENKGVGFINYDCTLKNRITKGLKDCKGQYYVFASRIDGRWYVNESSKKIIW